MIYQVSMRMILVSSVVAALLCVMLSAPLVGIFAPKGSAVYDMAIHGFRLFSVCFVFLGMNTYSSAMSIYYFRKMRNVYHYV